MGTVDDGAHQFLPRARGSGQVGDLREETDLRDVGSSRGGLAALLLEACILTPRPHVLCQRCLPLNSRGRLRAARPLVDDVVAILTPARAAETARAVAAGGVHGRTGVRLC